jgi:hypothetical protein
VPSKSKMKLANVRALLTPVGGTMETAVGKT